MKALVSIFLLAFSTLTYAGQTSQVTDSAKYSGDIHVNVAINSSVATNEAVRPLWSYSQEWGRYTQYDKWEASVYSKFLYHWHNRADWFSVNAGAALQTSTDRERMMLHEAYVSGRIWEIGYSLGREAFTPLDQRDGLGLGTFLMSDTARPITRFGLGFFDYWAIPGISDWIEIKGAFYIGGMPDEDNPEYTKNALLHEKLAYVRIGHFPVKPYVGLVHSVMMGGVLSNGKTMPVDFWASFFGKGSKKLLDAGYSGEYYNAAGGHQGMWDLGFDLDCDALSGSIYYQRPIYDMTAINLFDFAGCRDFTIGANVRLKDFRPVKSVCLEWLEMLWQGGNGPADPVFVSSGPQKTGKVVNLAVNEVTPDEIRKFVSGDWISEWEGDHGALTQQNCHACISDYVFRDKPGWTWGNRSPYLQNSYYPQGWTVGGLSMGSPIFLTSTTMSAVAPDHKFTSRFSNLRMRALSSGVSGEILPSLDYKLKFTYTLNYGCYNEQYYSGIDFDKKKPGYYFSSAKTEFYSGLWLNYRHKALCFNTTFLYDFGEIYRSFSVRVGMSISLDCPRSKH